MFDHSFDHTPVSAESMPYEFKQSALSSTPHSTKRVRIESTGFVLLSNLKPLIRGNRAELTGEMSSSLTGLSEDPIEADSGEFQHSEEVARFASQRARLLGYEAADSADKEALARIAVLTQRLRKLSPRVTSAQIENQQAMVELAEGISERLASIRAQLIR